MVLTQTLQPTCRTIVDTADNRFELDAPERRHGSPPTEAVLALPADDDDALPVEPSRTRPGRRLDVGESRRPRSDERTQTLVEQWRIPTHRPTELDRARTARPDGRIAHRARDAANGCRPLASLVRGRVQAHGLA